MSRITTKLKSLSKQNKPNKHSDIIVGAGSSYGQKLKPKKWHLIILALAFVGIGYIIIKSFAYSCNTNVCIISPEQGSAKTDDFVIRTQVKYQLSGSKYHIKVWLDKGKPGEQLVEIRRKTTELTNGNIHDFSFYFGNPSSGTDGVYRFNRNLLTPGTHTITAEQYNNELPALGSVVATDTKSFSITNVKNLATSTEPQKTFFAKNSPLSAGSSPRLASLEKQSPAQRATDTISQIKVPFALTPKVSAHTGTGYRHGDIDVIARLADGTPVAGVTVNVRHAGGTLDGCHTGNSATTKSTGDANFRDCAVTNNGCLNDPTCSATYTITVSNTPAGYSLDDVSSKNMTVVWQQNKDINFIYKRSAVAPPPNCQSPATSPTNHYRTPLLRFWSGQWTDHVYQTTQMDPCGLQVGFCYEGNVGYVYPNQVVGTTPLHRYFNYQSGNPADHVFTINRDDAGHARIGYTYEGPAGYVSPTQVTGTVPLYRFYHPGIVDHFYSTNYAEGVNAGYTYQWIEGYVWTASGANYYYYPSSPPLLSMTALASDKVTFDAFGLGMGYSGFPDLKTIASVRATVDGRVTDDRSLSTSSYNTIFGATANLGNIADGNYHNVTLSVTGINGKSTTLTFKIDPYQPYTNITPSNLLSANTTLPIDDILTASTAPTNVGSISVRTYYSNSDNDTNYFETLAPQIQTRADNLGTTTKECPNGIVGYTEYVPSVKLTRMTYSNCPVRQKDASNSYAKAYLVSALIPKGYHIDTNQAKVTKTYVTTDASGLTWANRRVLVKKDKTRTVSFSFVKNAALLPTAPESLAESLFVGSEEQTMLSLVNEYRKNNNVPPLTYSTTLQEVARRHSLDMAQSGLFAHIGYDCSSHDDRIRRYLNLDGYNLYAAENIAWGDLSYKTVRYLHDALVNSPDHRKNLLDPRFKEIGIGMVYRKDALTTASYDKSCDRGDKWSEALKADSKFVTQVFAELSPSGN